MANGAVRELITKVTFKLDRTALNSVNKTIRELKQNLNSLSRGKNNIKLGVNTASINTAISNIRGKLARNKIDISVRVNPTSLNNAIAQIKSRLARNNANVQVRVNPASLNSAIAYIRRQIARRAMEVKVRVNPASLNNAITQIRNRMAHLNLNIHANASVATIRANVIHLHGALHGGGGSGHSVSSAIGGGVVGGAVGGGLKNFASSALGLATAYGGYVGAGQITSTADAMLSLDGRIRNVTQSERERLDVESELYAMGQKTGQSLRGLGDLYIAIASSSNELGFSQRDNLKVAETVSKALGAGGASAGQTQAAILQLGQALGSGVLQGDELRSLRESAPTLMRAMAKYFKTTIAGLKKMGAEGKLTSEEVMKSILAASKEVDEQFANMPLSFSGAMSMMGNAWDRFIMKVEQKSTIFTTIAKGFGKAFEDLGNTFDDFNLLMGKPDPNKMVTITEASTGETKQISETDYYAQKAKQNPQMMETVKQLQEFSRMLDELDGKTGNIDEQIAGWVKTLLTVGAVLAPILAILTAISAIITILSPIVSTIAGLFSSIATALEPVITALAGLSLGELALVLVIVASTIYTVIEYWDALVKLFEPGIKMMKSGLKDLQDAWEEIQPLIEAVTPLLKVVATVIGVTIVGAVAFLFTVFSGVFKGIAKLINWIAGLLGGIGETIQWLADGLSGLINKALEFIGMKGSISEVNRSFVQGMWDRATGNNTANTTNTQNNIFNLANMGQLPAATNSTNNFFAYQ